MTVIVMMIAELMVGKDGVKEFCGSFSAMALRLYFAGDVVKLIYF